MADYYVDSDMGNDTTGDGTALLPWATLTKAKAVLGSVSDATIHLADIHTYTLSWDSTVNLTIQQWAGRTAAKAFNVIEMVASGWTNTVGNVYTKNIGASLSIGSFVSHYVSRVDSTGGKGHFKLAASAAAVIGDSFSFFYDSVTGLLTLDVGTDESPNDVASNYWAVRKNVSLWSFLTTTGLRLRGLWIALTAGQISDTYCVIADGPDNMCIDCDIDDGGVHNVLFTGTTTNPNTGSGCDGCRIRGADGGGASSILATHYATTGDIQTGFYRNCWFGLFSYRYPSGAVINPTRDVSGFYAHTFGSGAGNEILANGITIENCTFTRGVNPGTETDLRNCIAPTVGSTTATDYPLIQRGNTFNNAYHFGGYRTYMERNVCLSPTAIAVANVARFGASVDLGINQVCLLANFIAANQYSNDGLWRSIFDGRNASGSDHTYYIRFNNTILEINAITPNYWPRDISWHGVGSSGRRYDRGNVIAGKMGGSTKGLTYNVGDDSMAEGPGAAIDCLGNWYFGEDESYGNNFSSLAGRATLALWRTNVDTIADGGVYQVDPLIASPLTSATPAATSPLRTTRFFQAVHAALGINRVPYGNYYGAWQRPASINTIRSFALDAIGYYDDEE